MLAGLVAAVETRGTRCGRQFQGAATASRELHGDRGGAGFQEVDPYGHSLAQLSDCITGVLNIQVMLGSVRS